MYFRTRSARTGSSRRPPEVILFAFSFYSFIRNTDTSPNIIRFVISFKNSYPESVFIKFKYFCYKFPRSWHNLFFIVVAEREVSKHFKKGVMSRSSSNIFNIRIFSSCSCAFLAGSRSCRIIR